jgi:hypothetical protein
MAYDVAGLTDYVKENADRILTRSILGMRSARFMTVQPGIKSSEKIANLMTEASLQGGSCGWSPTATTTLANRTLEVTDIMSQESLCTKVLEKKMLQLKVRKGAMAGAEDMPIEQIWVEDKIKQVNKNIDVLIWQGDKTLAADPVRKWIDGLLLILDADMPAANIIARTASIIDDIDTLVTTKIPEDVLGSGNVLSGYMSISNFTKLTTEIRNKNWFHIPQNELGDFVMRYPGVPLDVIGVTGLQGKNQILVGHPDNFFIGTDLEEDFESVKFWYSEDNLEHRFHMNFRLGVQVAFPEEVVGAGASAGNLL